MTHYPLYQAKTGLCVQICVNACVSECVVLNTVTLILSKHVHQSNLGERSSIVWSPLLLSSPPYLNPLQLKESKERKRKKRKREGGGGEEES